MSENQIKKWQVLAIIALVTTALIGLITTAFALDFIIKNGLIVIESSECEIVEDEIDINKTLVK